MDFPLLKNRKYQTRVLRTLTVMLPVSLLLTGWFGCAAPPIYQPCPHQHHPAVQPQRNTAASVSKRPMQAVAPQRFAPNSPAFSASSELNQPWDLNRLQSRSVSPNPYLLVSALQPKAIQPAANTAGSLNTKTAAGAADSLNTKNSLSVKTVPPKVNVETFLTPVKRTAAVSHSSGNVPVLNLGKDLMNELRPSNHRKWSQNHAVMPTAEISGNRVTVKNIRYSQYESAEQYTTRYYDAVFNLDEIRTIDLIVVPFRAAPRLAHIQTSFGFTDGRQLGLSIEARYEEGEKYDALGSALRQFELIYVFADERDLIRIGTDVNKNDVHIYRLKFEPNEVREMFIDAVQRADKLAQTPEFYHPLRNSCVTNLIAHINKGRPKAIPREYRTLLPGLLDNYVYDLKLVDTPAKEFKQAKENAKVNWLVEKYGDLEYFSAGIRQNMY